MCVCVCTVQPLNCVTEYCVCMLVKVDRLENPQNEFVPGAVKGVSHRGQSSWELKTFNVYDLLEPFPDFKKKKKRNQI